MVGRTDRADGAIGRIRSVAENAAREMFGRSNTVEHDLSGRPEAGLRPKTALVGLLVVFAGTVFLTQWLEQLFPIVPIALVLSAACILSAFLGQDGLTGSLAVTGCVGSAYFVYVSGFPASMVGVDPDLFALWTQNVMRYGTVDAIGSQFYSGAPLFLVLGAIVGLITDLIAPEAFLFFPVASGFVFTFTTAAITMRIFANRDAALIAAVMAVLATQTVTYSITQIAQLLAVLYWVGLVLVLLFTIQRNQHVFPGLALLLLVASALTHKIAIAIAVGAVVAFYVALVALTKAGIREESATFRLSRVPRWGLIAGLILAGQWEYLTNYTGRAVGRVLAIDLFSGSVPAPEYTQAVPLNADLPSILAYALSIVLILLLAGLAWAILAYLDHHRDDTVLLLSSCAVTAIVAIVGIIAPITPGRLLFFGESLFIVLIAGVVVVKLGPRKAVLIVGVVLFISVQLFAASAMPDYTDTTQSYLTSSEVDAKSWGEEHAVAVYTDHHYAQENLPSNIANIEQPDVYQPYGDEVLNGEVSDEYQCVSYRENANGIHAVPSGTYKMTWDFRSQLDRQFGKVYSTGDTINYC